MRLLIVSDSHGRAMDLAISSIDSRWRVMVVKFGRISSAVLGTYTVQLPLVTRFEPEAIILHIGHNDLVSHPRHNPRPQSLESFFPQVMHFAELLRVNHPRSRVVVSSLLPRTLGPFMDERRMREYNSLALEFGDKLEAACRLMRVIFTRNGVLWSSVEEERAHPVYFMGDGLHLSLLGREAVGRMWMDEVVA
jgi:lysophospholipase L1-like esterase